MEKYSVNLKIHLHFSRPPSILQSSFVWHLMSIYSVPYIMLRKINMVFLLLMVLNG